MSEKRDGRDIARPQADRAELERKWGDAIAKALRTPPMPKDEEPEKPTRAKGRGSHGRSGT